MGCAHFVAAGLRLVHLRPMERYPLLPARRHRRQHADDAGSRPASRPGMVRPSAVSAESADRIEHPLVAARRSADRWVDSAAAAADRRRHGRALGGGNRPAVAVPPSVVLGGANGPPADRSTCLHPGLRRVVFRRIDQRHVHARADRSPRVAAGVPGAGDRGDCRPEEASRRTDARVRDRAVADHRARNAGLSGACRRGAGVVLGHRPG